jgi:TonB-linked SusC/RagA family outer membrane protein
MRQKCKLIIIAMGLACFTSTLYGQEVIDESEMNNKEIATNAIDAIKGRVAGMQVETTGNALSAVRLRGTTSLSGGNDPLVIVDGVMGDIRMLESILPTDIKSFNILKDASETAQYGSRGAAGVIVVNTQQGSEGETRLTYNTSLSISPIYKRLKMLDADTYRLAIQQFNMGILDKGYNTDFQKMIDRTGFTQNHHLALTGGNESSNYRVAVGYFDGTTVIKGRDENSLFSNINVTHKMWDGFMRIDLGMFGSINKNKGIKDEQKLFYSAAAFNPTFPNHPNADGGWDGYGAASQIDNPNVLLNEKNDTKMGNLALHARLTLQLLKELDFTLFGGYTYNNTENGTSTAGDASRSQLRREFTMGNATLRFNKSWNDHTLKATGLFELNHELLQGFNVAVAEMSTGLVGYDNLSAGSIRPWDGTASMKETSKMVSFMGKAEYDYADRYKMGFTLRADGSSKFGSNNRWGYFPSVSASWNLHNEQFMKSVDWLNELTLSCGYGLAGNQGAIDSYTAMRLLRPNGIAATGIKPIATFQELTNANPDLKWEVTRTVNLGINTKMLNGRLVFTTSIYNTKTTDMLYPYTVSVPPFKYPTMMANLGSMRNTGIEFSIGGTLIATKDISLNVSTNLTFQKNKLVSLGGNYKGEELYAPTEIAIAGVNGAGLHGDNQITFQVIGQPLGVFMLPHSEGLEFWEDGITTYYLTDGMRKVRGQAIPKALMGSNISFRYKDFDVDIQVNGAFGHKIYNGTSLQYVNIGSLPFYNVLAKAAEKNIYDLTITDYWLESGDYVNIDYITLGWRIPLKENKIVKSMRMTLTMNNVATFTHYSGLTPMINSSDINSTVGVDDKRTYPLYHTYTLGVSVNF